MDIRQLKVNPKNPRTIKDEKFRQLCKSIQEFPEMMEKRPIVCVTDTDGKLYPLGGNMRLKALKELNYKEIPDSWVVLADDWTVEQRAEFTIKDNVGFGEWNFDELLSDWDADLLKDWGLDMPEFEDKKENNLHGTVGNSVISDRPKALVLLEIKDELDLFNFKSIFSNYTWIKNGVVEQKFIFDFIDFVKIIKNEIPNTDIQKE